MAVPPRPAPVLHLVDVVAIVVAVICAVGFLAVPTDRLDGQIVNRHAHALLSVLVACFGALLLRVVVRQPRPTWHIPVLVLALLPACYSGVRIVNATADAGEVTLHRTQVIAWNTRPLPPSRGRRHGVFVRDVLLADWRGQGSPLTLRVPDGSIERETGFMQARREQVSQSANPSPSIEELMFPSGHAIQVFTKPGALGLVHVVGLKLLLAEQ